jgi:predicted alpha/beta-fold hydrolase
MTSLFYTKEFPKVFTQNRDITLDIFYQPVKWFKPFFTLMGQMALYRLKIQDMELQSSENLNTKIIKMQDGTNIKLGFTYPKNPKCVLLYLHTVCGTYTQMAHLADIMKKENIAYVSYTRSGNDPLMSFSKFNFIGRVDELDIVLDHIKLMFPGKPIHVMGASAGSALLIRYLGRHNQHKKIKSGILVSPGYSFIEAMNDMNMASKSYLVNKLKYMVKDNGDLNALKKIKSLDDWIKYQSDSLGYKNTNLFIKDQDPMHYLDKINVPTLFISALDDNIFTKELVEKYLQKTVSNKNNIIVLLDRGGHVMFDDEGHSEAWFIRAAKEWIQKIT